jgi:diguanylate cyclase (GGDEF)-like protein
VVRFYRRNPVLAAVILAAALFAVSAGILLSRSVARDEYATTDARLAAELGEAVRVLEDLGRNARGRAVRLAASAEVQSALARRDAPSLKRIAAGTPGIAFDVDGARIGGGAGSGAVMIPASVVAGGYEVGRVLVAVPVAAIAERVALAPGDRLIAARATILTSSPSTLTIDGERYRAISTSGGSTRLTVLAPEEPIAEAVRDRRLRVLLAVFGSSAAFVLLAVLALRHTRRPTRRLLRMGDRPPSGRRDRRSREAAELVGNVLAAGHDVEALLPVILESAVTITGAASARLIADGNELARAGAMEGAGPPLSISLAAGSNTDALLVLHPRRGAGFDDEAVELAEWLAGRASIALQNAHLHSVTRQLATTDELTQLANRRQFDEALAAEVLRAERFRDRVAVVVADLDNFKEINDRFGHDVGDLVLRAFAAAIRSNVRDVDLPARYGGEEFTVLLPSTDAEGGSLLAERLRLAVEELTVDSGGAGPVAVRSSFGVASYPAEPSAAALMRAADRALYRAKASGKNTVVVAEREVASAQ